MTTKTSKVKKQIVIPRKNQVLIEPEEVKKSGATTDSGLYLPDNEAKEEKAFGKVIAKGSEVGEDIKIGDRVIFGMFLGDKIKLGESTKEYDFILVADEEVIAFIKNE
jgi:co-chaperonin GroES (HSP10)